MELFWELALTVALSLLLPSIFIKLLSVAPSYDANDKVAITSRDHGVPSDIQNWESEEVVRIAGKFEDFRGESILGKLSVPEILEVSCGSPKIDNAEKIDENIVVNEIEVVDLINDHVEKISHDCGSICGREKNLSIDESNQRTKISEVDIELINDESRVSKVEEVEISHPLCDGNFDEIENCVDSEQEWLEEDDWEGIESTELERLFGAAVVFVESKSNANRIANLNNDAKMQLYGFHKIATQGPCQNPQPMALNFSARAKWNAWQQLGIMSPEIAMERYITILSKNIPDWMPDNPIENDKSVYADIQAFE